VTAGLSRDGAAETVMERFWDVYHRARRARGLEEYETAAVLYQQAHDLLPAGNTAREGLAEAVKAMEASAAGQAREQGPLTDPVLDVYDVSVWFRRPAARLRADAVFRGVPYSQAREIVLARGPSSVCADALQRGHFEEDGIRYKRELSYVPARSRPAPPRRKPYQERDLMQSGPVGYGARVVSEAE
jgi:hypothetical protein